MMSMSMRSSASDSSGTTVTSSRVRTVHPLLNIFEEERTALPASFPRHRRVNQPLYEEHRLPWLTCHRSHGQILWPGACMSMCQHIDPQSTAAHKEMKSSKERRGRLNSRDRTGHQLLLLRWKDNMNFCCIELNVFSLTCWRPVTPRRRLWHDAFCVDLVDNRLLLPRRPDGCAVQMAAGKACEAAVVRAHRRQLVEHRDVE
jgi:hypothetical protein